MVTAGTSSDVVAGDTVDDGNGALPVALGLVVVPIVSGSDTGCTPPSIVAGVLLLGVCAVVDGVNVETTVGYATCAPLLPTDKASNPDSTASFRRDISSLEPTA